MTRLAWMATGADDANRDNKGWRRVVSGQTSWCGPQRDSSVHFYRLSFCRILSERKEGPRPREFAAHGCASRWIQRLEESTIHGPRYGKGKEGHGPRAEMLPHTRRLREGRPGAQARRRCGRPIVVAILARETKAEEAGLAWLAKKGRRHCFCFVRRLRRRCARNASAAATITSMLAQWEYRRSG